MGNYIEQKYSFSTFRTQWRRMLSGFAEVMFHIPKIVKKSGFLQTLYNISKIIKLETHFDLSYIRNSECPYLVFRVFRWRKTVWKLQRLFIHYPGVYQGHCDISHASKCHPLCNRQLRCDGCGILLEQSINFSVLVGPSFF